MCSLLYIICRFKKEETRPWLDNLFIIQAKYSILVDLSFFLCFRNHSSVWFQIDIMSSDGNANDTGAQPSLSPESLNIAQHESSSNQNVVVAINSMQSNFDKTNDLISRLVHAIESKNMQAEKLAPKRVIEITDNNSDEPAPKRAKIAPKTGQHSRGKDHNYNEPPEQWRRKRAGRDAFRPPQKIFMQ